MTLKTNFNVIDNSYKKDDSLLIIVIGSDTGDFNEISDPASYILDVSNLSKIAKTTLVIGDPVNGFEISELRAIIEPHVKNMDEVNIFSIMHGEVNEESEFVIYSDLNLDKYGDEIPSLNIDYFKALKEVTANKVVNMFSVSCYGRAAQNDFKIFPDNSTLITLYDSEHPGYIIDFYNPSVYNYFNDVKNFNHFDIESYLQLYLASQRFMDNNPSLMINGQAINNLEGNTEFLGQVISEDAKEYIYNHYGRIALNYGFIDRENFERVLDKVQNSHSLDSFHSFTPFKEKFIFETELTKVTNEIEVLCGGNESCWEQYDPKYLNHFLYGNEHAEQTEAFNIFIKHLFEEINQNIIEFCNGSDLCISQFDLEYVKNKTFRDISNVNGHPKDYTLVSIMQDNLINTDTSCIDSNNLIEPYFDHPSDYSVALGILYDLSKYEQLYHL